MVIVGLAYGIATGILISRVARPGGREVEQRIVWAAAVVQLGIAVITGTFFLDVGTWTMVALAVGFVVSGMLMDAQVWRDSPFLAGERYWSRVWLCFMNRRAVRDAARESERNDDLYLSA